MVELVVVEGDITQQDVDAVVNAANPRLAPGGGVAGAIHDAAGPRLWQECRERYPDGVPTGSAGWTSGCDLTARWVIHAVGPVFELSRVEQDRRLLASCYTTSLDLAEELGAHTIAFPLISAGIYGWPFDDAARTAAAAIRGYETSVVEEARLVAYGADAHRRLTDALG